MALTLHNLRHTYSPNSPTARVSNLIAYR